PSPPRHPPHHTPHGVPGHQAAHLPAPPVDAHRRRHDAVLHRGDAALAPDLGVRVPHPRGGEHRRPGARVHAGERLRVRRGGDGGRTGGRPRPPPPFPSSLTAPPSFPSPHPTPP